MPFTTVAVIGATGNLGVHIVRSLMNKKELKITIITRSESLTSKTELLTEFKDGGATIVAVDFTDKESMVAALTGVDVVVSATSGYALLEQLPLIDAAQAAGVKRFYPSEFGISHQGLNGIGHPIMDMKKKVIKHALDAGLEVVAAATGFFAEWMMSPFYTVDHANSTVEIVGDGNVKIGFWPLPQVGQVVAESINHPMLQGKKEYQLNVQGIITTWNEILDAHERVTGTKWRRSYVSIKEAKKRVAANNKPFDDFGTYLRIWQAEGYGVSLDNAASQFDIVPPTFYDMFKKEWSKRPFTSVAVTGATGNLGVHIARALLNRKELQTTILTRPDTLRSKKELLAEFKACGARVVAVDFKDPASLAAALSGVDVLVSATSGYALLEQLPLIDAAQSAGVRRFYPSEFGIDHLGFPGVQHPIMDMKKQVIRHALDAGLEVVAAATGFFAEWMMSPFYTVDHANSTVEIVGDGNMKVGFWPLPQVGQVVAESINHPMLKGGDKQEYRLNVQGIITTWNALLDDHERATGSKWRRSYVSVQEAKQRVAANNMPFDDFGTYLRIWQAEGFAVSPDNAASQFAITPDTFYDMFKRSAPAPPPAPTPEPEVPTPAPKSAGPMPALRSEGSTAPAPRGAGALMPAAPKSGGPMPEPQSEGSTVPAALKAVALKPAAPKSGGLLSCFGCFR